VKVFWKALTKESCRVAIRIGAFSDDLASEFLPACALAAEAGLDGLAVRNVGGRNVVEAGTAELAGIRSQARDHGLVVASVGSQFGREFYVDSDEGQRAAEQTLRSALIVADVLQTELIRIFALWLPGQEPLETWSRRPVAEEYLERVADRLRPSVDLARRAGVVLMVELEGASYAGTVAEAELLLAALDSPAVALCWDVCNGWWSGEDPVADGLPRALTLPVVDVQTKDVPALPDRPRTPTFGRAVTTEGDVGYPAIVPALVTSGYQGWFTAERVHHPAKPEHDLALQQATLADIARLRQTIFASGKGITSSV
jgi:sugar phosphate isomerase/epimerase